VLGLKRIPFDRAIDAMTAAPARVLGLKGKGALKAGADADITLIDRRAKWPVDPASFKSKGRCTPYEGMSLSGRAVRVYVGGRACT
jgi:dihydroorotase